MNRALPETSAVLAGRTIYKTHTGEFLLTAQKAVKERRTDQKRNSTHQ